MRWRSPWIRPIELWDALVEGRTLFEWQREAAALPGVLDALVQQLQRGLATFEDGRPSPPACPALGHVHLLGGGALGLALPARLPRAGLPVTVAADPLYAAALAGVTLAAGALVADVGQTAVKIVSRGMRAHAPRDFAALPLASALPAEALADARAAVVAFVAAAIGQALGDARPPAVVLALPCALDDALVASGCSYPYPKRDPALARDLLAAAGLGAVPALVLNDAELAAHAAALDPQVPRDRLTLVLTLGFGAGGALLEPRP